VRRPLRAFVVLLLIAAVSLPSPAKKKKVTAALLEPGVITELPTPTSAVAVQKCENWAWAAGVETILHSQDVPLDQHYWVQKADGGEICLETLAPLAQLARVVNGEYVIGVGRKVKLEARFVVGAPVHTDAVIEGLRRGQPALMVWRGHAYVIYGVVYDVYVSPVGYKFFEVREIKLLDPFYDDGRRLTSFVRSRDDIAEIGGIFEITVTPNQPTDWLRR
jgi:hypothetical protein